MADGARAKARERLAVFSDRAGLLTAALEKIRPVPTILIEGRPGFRTESDVFILETTCSEPLAKETTHALNQMFAAFQRHFSVRRNAGKKVTVYFFADRAEYDAFQEATLGGAVMNPAFYDPKANHIAAFNRVETAKAEAVRKAILEAEREIEECKVKINREEVRIDRLVREIKAKLDNLVTQAKREARGDPKAMLELVKRSTVPLEKVVVAGGESFMVTHPTEADRSNAHYASAWGLAHYLISKGTTRDQFEAYAKASQAGDAKRAIEILAGKPLSQLEPEWRVYLSGLK